ncbi:MAG: acyltransferase [Crocinitomicaceae bacterium]
MKQQSDKKIPKIYFENLDALRFIAALSVFLFHFSADMKAVYPVFTEHALGKAILSIFEKGSLGVNFFFVLSGFLITYLILHEVKHRGAFALGKFLIRRTVRIWPLYFIVVLIGFVLFPAIIPGYETNHDPVMYLFFLANFDEIYNGMADSVNFLTSPWSVAVEEQFYLFWGILLLIWSKISKLKLPAIIIMLYVLSFIFRAVHWEEERLIYYHTFAVCQDILTGSFVAWSLFHEKKWINSLQNIKTPAVLGIYVLGFILCVLKNKVFFGELIVIERFVLSLFFAFIVLDQIRGKHSVLKMGKYKTFNYLGKISYGLYMYHLVVMYLLFNWMNSWGAHGYWLVPIYLILSFGATVTIASCSYHLIEKPLLKLKPH